MRFVKANQNKPIKALRNVGPELEKLRLKAAATIRDFFIERINALLVPNTNVQIMQQSVFLKYKELHQFVIERHHDAATEIRQTYVNALKWYFHNHFERYSKGLSKLQVKKKVNEIFIFCLVIYLLPPDAFYIFVVVRQLQLIRLI